MKFAPKKDPPNSDDASLAIDRIERWTKKQGLHGNQGPLTSVDKRLRDIKTVRDYIESLHRNTITASFTLMDWDGYYNPNTGRGSVKGLAQIVEESYIALQGKSWRGCDKQEADENNERFRRTDGE